MVAQGVENSARQDLSFIERAIFAMRLEDAGHDRPVIQEALSIDRAEVSKLLSVARSMPADLVTAIGRAPKAGRGRWQLLVRVLQEPDMLKQARAAISRKGFERLDSDQRFLAILELASGKREAKNEEGKAYPLQSKSGVVIARVEQARGETRLVLDESGNPEFAAYLVAKLPDIFEAFHRKKPR